MRNGATTWRDHDRARNVSESRISQASEADLSGPLPMSALGQTQTCSCLRGTSVVPSKSGRLHAVPAKRVLMGGH